MNEDIWSDVGIVDSPEPGSLDLGLHSWSSESAFGINLGLDTRSSNGVFGSQSGMSQLNFHSRPPQCTLSSHAVCFNLSSNPGSAKSCFCFESGCSQLSSQSRSPESILSSNPFGGDFSLYPGSPESSFCGNFCLNSGSGKCRFGGSPRSGKLSCEPWPSKCRLNFDSRAVSG